MKSIFLFLFILKFLVGQVVALFSFSSLAHLALDSDCISLQMLEVLREIQLEVVEEHF